jgi:GntR family transcriptional regulator
MTTAHAHLTALGSRRRVRADRAIQVADVLRRQVLRGYLTDGLLPSEGRLATEFEVSRNTVRESLELLRREGLVERVSGLGTRVVRSKYLHGIDELCGLAETLNGVGRVRNEVRVSSLVPAPESVARRLEVSPGEPVTYVERRRFADDLPLSLDLTYLVRDLGESVLGHDLTANDVFALLEHLSGTPLGDAEMTLEATNADAHSAAILGVPAGAPLMMLERLTRLQDGRPVDLEFIRLRGDRVTMRGTARRGPHGHAPVPRSSGDAETGARAAPRR